MLVVDDRPEMGLIRLFVMGLDIGAYINVSISLSEFPFDILNSPLSLTVFPGGFKQLNIIFCNSNHHMTNKYFSSNPKEFLIKESVRELFLGSESFLLYLRVGSIYLRNIDESKNSCACIDEILNYLKSITFCQFMKETGWQNFYRSILRMRLWK